ncbi:MAG TPA: ribonuclease III [Candidatus Pacearchaeota archaeon]|nr:ribonuclease III [Candidatus Pacearchaeota archaeon]HQI74748.1 ribonuclease III [Candidatus Pacearchaeota archaeon]
MTKNNLIEKFESLLKDLNIDFSEKDLLVKAFVHRSFLNENKGLVKEHNERLEFLGDAVLELIVTDYLYHNYPESSEGALTSWRSALVNSTMLSQKAKELNFEEYLLLSKGESKETGKSRQLIMANTFEAFIGALYLDKGYGACREFIERHLIKKELDSIIEKRLFLDGKSYFQEKAQEIDKVTPTYQVLEEWGPDHDKHFKVGVYLKDSLCAVGEGSSKQEAEESAAKQALKIKDWNKEK